MSISNQFSTHSYCIGTFFFFIRTGNGKRSWSPPPPEVEDKRADEFGRTVLRNVLLKRFNSFEPEDKYYSDSDRFYPMDSEFREEGDSGVKNDYLRELLQEQVNE